MKFYLIAVSFLLATVACNANEGDTVAQTVIQHEVHISTVTTPEITIQQNPEWVVVDANQLKSLLSMFNEQSSVAILNTVTTKSVVEIVQYIQTTTVSTADWEFVFSQLHGKKDAEFAKLLSVGTSLSFGSPKIVYYTALLNYLIKHESDEKVKAVLSVRQPSVTTFNYDPLIQYNPLFQFLKLEQQLLKEFKEILVNALTLKQIVNHPLLDQVQWNVLWELNYGAVQGTYFPLHVILNQTVVENWNLVDLQAIVKQLDKIPNDTENNKIKKLQWYIALLNGAHIHISEGVNDYFSLVLSFEEFIQGLTFGSGNDQGHLTILNAQNAYHGCAKFIFSRPANNIYSIQNRHFQEYFYTAMPNPGDKPKGWLTTPKDLNKNTYRPAFTWRKDTLQTEFMPYFKWHIERANRRFWLRSVHFPELYLDTTHQTHAHMVKATSQLPRLAVWFVPSKIDNEACSIRNYDGTNYMYAGENRAAEDEKRRTVFTNGSSEDEVNRAYLWYIRDYRQNIIKAE